MEFTQLLSERRSIRAYKADTAVEKSVVEEILKAAGQAPSWKNSQTGRYYVIMSPEKLKEIKETCLPSFNQNACSNAPVLIVTAFEKNRSGFERDGQPVNELGNEWGAYDLGLQNENLVLKARELGLDTLIMGIRDSEKLRTLLAVPDSQEIVSVIALGYRAVNPDAPARKDISEIVKFF